MKRWYIHGTGYVSGKNIETNGFDTNYQKRIWNCSDYDRIYIRCIDEEDMDENKIQNFYDCNDFYNHDINSYEEAFKRVIYESLWNANLSSAITKSPNNETYLYFFLLDDMEESLQSDASCENMDNCYSISRKIADLRCKFKIVIESYIPEYRIFYIKEALNNFLNEDEIETNKFEETIYNQISDTSEIYCQSMEYIDDAINEFNIISLINKLNTIKKETK